MTVTTRRWVPLLALLALLVAACGGEEADPAATEEDPAATEEDPEAEEPAAPPEEADPEATEEPAEAAAPDDEAEPAEEAPPTGENATEEEMADEQEAAGEEAMGGTAGGVTLALTETSLGQVLADGDGMVLYLFDPDEAGESTCYDQCASNWPPLIGPAEAGNGVDEALISTTGRDDGEMQVTYNEWPVYYFAGDSAPGDVNGQGIQDVWWVVSPDGERITETAEAAAAAY